MVLPSVAACSLLLAACGGDDDSSTSDPTPTEAPSGLSVSVSPERATPGSSIEAAVVNGTEEQFIYGAAYELERQVGDDFEEVELPKRPVIQIAYVAEPGETGPAVAVKIPGSAELGTYRVVIQRDVPDVGDLNGEFEVVAEN